MKLKWSVLPLLSHSHLLMPVGANSFFLMVFLVLATNSAGYRMLQGRLRNLVGWQCGIFKKLEHTVLAVMETSEDVAIEGERIAECMFQGMVDCPKLHFVSCQRDTGLYSQKTLLAIFVSFTVIRLVLLKRERKKVCHHSGLSVFPLRKLMASWKLCLQY